MKRDRDYFSDRQEVLNRALHMKTPAQRSLTPAFVHTDFCDEQRRSASSVAPLLPIICTVLRVALILGLATKVCAGQTTLTSMRNHDLYVSLTNNAGKLVAEKDEYCALFSRTKGGAPMYVEDVFVEFAQQVGKIRESPAKAALLRDNQGRYCGKVDLGKQHYQPAFYYVTVRYTGSSKTKRTCHFFLTMK